MRRRTDARDIGAPVVPLLEPRQQRRVLGNQIDGVPARRGNDDDVGFFYYAQRTVRREPQSANRLHASAVDRSCPHPESRLCGFSMQPIPNHSRRVKDFDGSDRRRSIASFKNDNDYVQKSVAISAGPVRAAWSCRLRLAMSVGPLVRRDGLPQPDQSANRILEQCYSRNADTTKGSAMIDPPRAVPR